MTTELTILRESSEVDSSLLVEDQFSERFSHRDGSLRAYKEDQPRLEPRGKNEKKRKEGRTNIEARLRGDVVRRLISFLHLRRWWFR